MSLTFWGLILKGKTFLFKENAELRKPKSAAITAISSLVAIAAIAAPSALSLVLPAFPCQIEECSIAKHAEATTKEYI